MPTARMQNTDELKEIAYQELFNILRTVKGSDKILILGDFNARPGSQTPYGKPYSYWVHMVLGKSTQMVKCCFHYVQSSTCV